MMSEYQRPPVKVALMGLGRAMFDEHFPVFRDHPSLFEVVAACDLEKDRRDVVAASFPHCKMFRQFHDMLDERDIDIVDIATFSKDHVSHAIQSLQRGYWTLLETPIAFDPDMATQLRGASLKSKNRLLVLHRGLFSPDFLLARQMIASKRLGRVYEISIRREDFVRRDDWQAVKRLGGGAAYYAMPDLVLQALRLLPSQPVQMWSELKRIASLGDAEDYAHLILKTRDLVTADVKYNGGQIPGDRSQSFVIRGENGTFTVGAGAEKGVLRIVDPGFSFPRRRSSVRTPPLDDMHEEFPVVSETVSLDRGTLAGPSAFWRHVYNTVRVAAPFPITVEEALDAVKFTHLMKKTSPFGK